MPAPGGSSARSSTTVRGTNEPRRTDMTISAAIANGGEDRHDALERVAPDEQRMGHDPAQVERDHDRDHEQ